MIWFGLALGVLLLCWPLLQALWPLALLLGGVIVIGAVAGAITTALTRH